MNSLGPYFIRYVHLGDENNLAYLSAANGIGFLVGAIIVSAKKEWRKKVLFSFVSIFLVFAGIGLTGLTPSGEFFMLYIIGFIMMVPVPIVNTIMMTIMQKIVPPDKFGRFIAILSAMGSAITPIGYLISGPIASIIGIQNLYIMCSVLGILIITVSFLTGGLDIMKNGEFSSNKSKME